MQASKSGVGDGIGLGVCHHNVQPLALTGDDVVEYLGGELLALVVSHNADLQLLFVAEILVIVHLAREESVGTSLDGVRQHEVASSATQRHAAYLSRQQLVALYPWGVKYMAYVVDKRHGVHGLFQLSYHAAAA